MIEGFVLPELVLESVIRDGVQNVKDDPTIIDSIFAQLTRAYANEKYGSAEITKIKALIQKELAVVYSYHDVDAKVPCISIMVGTDSESIKNAHLGDLYEEKLVDITDAGELAALIKIPDLVVTAYDPLSGKVTVDDATDLSIIYRGMIFVDAANTPHTIINGISNVENDKFFFVAKNSDVDFSDTGLIKSSLAQKEYEVNGVMGDVAIVIGTHAKDPLTCKYLYLLVKYFILSRKEDLIKRNFNLASYSGSDFTRDSSYQGDRVYTRFLSVTGKVVDTWRADQVSLIDRVVIDGDPIE